MEAQKCRVCLFLREVYRVTESLQREKSGLLKQLDFLRCVSTTVFRERIPGALGWKGQSESAPCLHCARSEPLRECPHSSDPQHVTFGPFIQHAHISLQSVPLQVGSASFFVASLTAPCLVLAAVGGELNFLSSSPMADLVPFGTLSPSTKLRKGGQWLIQKLTEEEIESREMKQFTKRDTALHCRSQN